MKCDTARRSLSDRLDAAGEADHEAAVEDHLAGCPSCRRFITHLDGLRRHLHVAAVEAPPDVAPRVRARLEEAGRRRLPAPLHRWRVPAPASAVFVTAFVVAAVVVGFVGGPPGARAKDVSSLVLAGQRELASLTATVEVVEHGWHAEVPERRYTGRLLYLAPEKLALELEDRTRYPDGPWRSNDITVVVDEAGSWQSGRAACPRAALPDCLPGAPRERSVVGREPFDAADPIPLDLVLPVASFAVAGSGSSLGTAVVADRDAVGVEVSAAQVAPLLDGLRRTGNWRPFHPTDGAEVWLDAELGTPLSVEIRAAAGYERDLWAAANGLDERRGDPILTWRLDRLRVNEVDPDRSALPRPRITIDSVDHGFRADASAGLVPSWLPAGMEVHRRGRNGPVEVASFADGRAWLAIRTTTDWTGRRLFGHERGVVRRVRLDGSGIGYVAEGGGRVLVHGEAVDVEVVGSLPLEDLVRVAGSIGVRGDPVPDGWAEASTATLPEAAAARPGLLLLPDEVDGFDGPAVIVTSDGVVQSFVGGGARAFELSQVEGDGLGPPLDDVVLSIDLRGGTARYTPGRGTLEWVEDGSVVTLRSRTLGLPELARLGALLEARP